MPTSFSWSAWLPFEWIVALRFLREGRKQSLLIIAGVSAGVAVMVALSSLISGLQASLIARTLGTQAHIVLRPAEDVAHPALARDRDEQGQPRAMVSRIEPRVQRLRSIDQWQSIFAELQDTPGVSAVSPMVSGAALALRGTASKSVVLQGIDPERYRRIVRIEDDIVAGRFRVIGTEAVIGIELAHDLGVIVGDKVRLATTDNRSDVITVAGIFDIGNKDLNRRWVLVSTKLAQNLLDLPGGVSSIDLSVQEVFEAESIARSIASRHPLLVESWMATNSQLLAALRNQTMTNRIIRAFVILIVALGIASVLVVSVVQKQKEIGILRAMGVSGARVMRIFLIQGAMVGLLGSLLGSLLGIFMLWMSEKYIVNGDGSPLYVMQLDGPTFLAACLVAVVTGVLAAALPARSAARLDPVAAIRG